MSDLPFAITPDAEAYIERVLTDAQRCPKLLAMARELFYTSGGGSYPFPQILLVWNDLDKVIGNNKYTELELAGFRMFAQQSCIDRLRGKRIVLVKGKWTAGEDILAVK